MQQTHQHQHVGEDNDVGLVPYGHVPEEVILPVLSVRHGVVVVECYVVFLTEFPVL